MKLEEWIAATGNVVSDHSSGAKHLPFDDYRDLWHLEDWKVSSVVAGTIWLVRAPQPQHDSGDYWQAVEDLAEQIVEELNDAEEEDRNELLHRLLHENTDQHDYVINDELQLHVLRHSKHPCAALFNGTLGHSYQSTDDFPFAVFAGDAFEADVLAKVKELLDENRTPT